MRLSGLNVAMSDEPAGVRIEQVRITRWPADVLRAAFTTWHSWFGADQSLRALAELDDDQLSNLSESGQQLWRKARRKQRERRFAGGSPACIR
jgi:hypothetical protein